MSDAAAAVLLEARRDEPAGLLIDRFALAADATHITGSDPTGAALRHVLRQVCGDQPVDLFHAHGTGTPVNDAIELEAIDDVARGVPRPPVVYSHKGALGHSLGAAGLVSVVLNCMCHERGLVPGNCRTEDPLPAPNVVLPRHPMRREIRRSVALAAGFGGTVAAVSIVSTQGATFAGRATQSPT